MNWAAPYQPKRDRYWPEVEQFFSLLPPRLFRQGLLLKNNLATFYTDTGQFKDILRRDYDPPLLYLHFWLLDDWACPHNAARAELERQLFLAMFFAFAAAYTQECILDESTNFDQHFLFLHQTLIQQASFYLASLFPSSAPFWNYYQAFWHEYAEASLATADLWSPPPNPPLLAGRLAFAKISIAAVALKFERADLLPQLGTMLDQLNLVLQIVRDISTIRRDLGQRQLTYPILRTMQEADLDPLQAASPEQLLGALVLTGTIKKIGQECLARLGECRNLSDLLKLPTFTAYFTGLEKRIDEVSELFSLKGKAATASAAEKHRWPFFVPYVDTLPKVIEMAEGYLLSDLTFRESWEVQRRGVFGLAEMTGKAFPMGLLAEILSRHGHAMTAPINEVFETLRASGFRYYNHPHLPPDADDLGLLLRLYPYSAQPEQHHDLLQMPLRWLEQSSGETGPIPVWLNDTSDRAESPVVALWGNRCATVEANVLLGLIDYDWLGYRSPIEKWAENWCRQLLAEGLGATHHYIPLYALWTAFELISKLSHVILSEAKNPPLNNEEANFPGVQSDTTESNLLFKLNQVAQTLAECLALEANRPHLTPQDAAFLTLACLRLNQWSPKLALVPAASFKPDWITLLCKSQRYDGSWAAEPLYGTPTRGEFAAWYSSRSVTTGFCYHALKSYSLTWTSQNQRAL